MNMTTGVWLYHQVVLVQSLPSLPACNSSPSPSDEEHTCWRTQRMCTACFHVEDHVDCAGIGAGYTRQNNKLLCPHQTRT